MVPGRGEEGYTGWVTKPYQVRSCKQKALNKITVTESQVDSRLKGWGSTSNRHNYWLRRLFMRGQAHKNGMEGAASGSTCAESASSEMRTYHCRTSCKVSYKQYDTANATHGRQL